MATLHVLINPHAGGGRARRLQPRLQQWLHDRGADARVIMPETIGQAHGYLRTLPTAARVALVGGDGTVNQMLAVLVAHGLTLALVPQGSGNDLARALGIAQWPWTRCLELALQGADAPVDVGWLQTGEASRPFLSSLTVGFDSAVGYRALHGPRWLRGLPRYLWATLRELSALQTWSMEISVDGESMHRGTTLFASTLNTPSYGSGMPATPDARINDGQLNLLVAGDFNRAQALAMLPRLLAGTHLGHARIQTRTFREMHIQGDRPLPLATDGEYVGEAERVQVRVAPGQLRVVYATDAACVGWPARAQ